MSFRLHDFPDAWRKTGRALWGKEGKIVQKKHIIWFIVIDPFLQGARHCHGPRVFAYSLDTGGD